MRHPRATAIIGAAAIGALAVAVVWVQRRNPQETANQSANGELVTYDVSSKTLTLRTANGDRSFLVPDGTPLHEGAKAITLAALTSASGCPAKVWYRDGEGQLIVREVRISCAAVVSHEMPSRRQ